MSDLFNSLSNSLNTSPTLKLGEKKASVWYPNEKTGLELEVVYMDDEDAFSGIEIQSMTHKGVDLFELFSDSAIKDFELKILNQETDLLDFEDVANAA